MFYLKKDRVLISTVVMEGTVSSWKYAGEVEHVPAVVGQQNIKNITAAL